MCNDNSIVSGVMAVLVDGRAQPSFFMLGRCTYLYPVSIPLTLLAHTGSLAENHLLIFSDKNFLHRACAELN